MDLESLRLICLAYSGVREHFPFDEVTLVFKVGGKMFALTGLDGPPRVNLKCDPERAIDLRERYPAIRPGYHMSKKHWNTVDLDGSLSDNFIRELINHSYQLIVESLPKKIKDEIQATRDKKVNLKDNAGGTK